MFNIPSAQNLELSMESIHNPLRAAQCIKRCKGNCLLVAVKDEHIHCIGDSDRQMIQCLSPIVSISLSTVFATRRKHWKSAQHQSKTPQIFYVLYYDRF